LGEELSQWAKREMNDGVIEFDRVEKHEDAMDKMKTFVQDGWDMLDNINASLRETVDMDDADEDIEAELERLENEAKREHNVSLQPPMYHRTEPPVPIRTPIHNPPVLASSIFPNIPKGHPPGPRSPPTGVQHKKQPLLAEDESTRTKVISVPRVSHGEDPVPQTTEEIPESEEDESSGGDLPDDVLGGDVMEEREEDLSEESKRQMIRSAPVASGHVKTMYPGI